MPHNRSRLERETIILFNEEEDLATIFTTSPRVAAQLTKKLGKSEQLGPHSFQWEFPKEWVKLPTSKRRKISAEHKKKLMKSLSRARENRKIVNTGDERT